MICKKLVDPDDGGLWYLFYDKDSDDTPRMVMTERQALRFMEEMEKDISKKEEDEDG